VWIARGPSGGGAEISFRRDGEAIGNANSERHELRDHFAERRVLAADERNVLEPEIAEASDEEHAPALAKIGPKAHRSAPTHSRSRSAESSPTGGVERERRAVSALRRRARARARRQVRRECLELTAYHGHRMAIAHLPTTAKDGCRTQGLTAERGHAEAVKQMAPSPFAIEITAGITTNSTKNAPNIPATRAPRGLAFVMNSEAQ
jgi:hypothetical protein